VVFGVEGGRYAAGAALSPEVLTAVERVAEDVVRELEGDAHDA
jgi:hypothetical protein